MKNKTYGVEVCLEINSDIEVEYSHLADALYAMHIQLKSVRFSWNSYSDKLHHFLVNTQVPNVQVQCYYETNDKTPRKLLELQKLVSLSFKSSCETSLPRKFVSLAQRKNVVTLAHYYVDEDVQEVADYIGDSYYLSKVATKVDADRIVFAGVEFMGESAKLLNKEKRVFMPDATADCPMAHMATAEEIKAVKEKYEDVAVVCYINSTVELKALADVCVTSANAVI